MTDPHDPAAPTADLPEIVEMNPAEGAWVEWAMASDIDTGGLCGCGHEGLGVDWHTGDCRGANYALKRKVQELFAQSEAKRDRPDQCGEWTPTMFTDQLATTWCIRWPGHGAPHRDQNGCEWREVR